jgi:hypothetical protein
MGPSRKQKTVVALASICRRALTFASENHGRVRLLAPHVLAAEGSLKADPSRDIRKADKIHPQPNALWGTDHFQCSRPVHRRSSDPIYQLEYDRHPQSLGPPRSIPAQKRRQVLGGLQNSQE